MLQSRDQPRLRLSFVRQRLGHCIIDGAGDHQTIDFRDLGLTAAGESSNDLVIPFTIIRERNEDQHARPELQV